MKKCKIFSMLLVVSLTAGLAACGMDDGELGVAQYELKGVTGINVVLNAPLTDEMLNELDCFGRVLDVVAEINGVTMRAAPKKLDAIRALPFVESASPDQHRTGAPVDTVSNTNFFDGLSTWDLDAINVTDYGFDNRQVAEDGTGVYVAVLDTGLLDTWRQYFPEQRIVSEYARCFGGGGGEMGFVSSQPNKWEHDTDSHGTHVTSTIIGYSLYGTPVNGVAPLAKIIPVKVLGQDGSGWSSVVARGIVYVADLKAGPLADYPVVINMSLGGPYMDTFEKAAMDYAIAQGVIIVAAAGNEGRRGMSYPGAYAPVISAAAAGFVEEWTASNWWYAIDVADPTDPAEFYIADFSSRARKGQDLDVTAPGSWVLGPYQIQNGQISYYYLGGTSMASPHVAGAVALMVQKDPTLTAAQAEEILEATAVPMDEWGSVAAGAGMIDVQAALQAL